MPFLAIHEAIGLALVGRPVVPAVDLGGQGRGMPISAFDGRLDEKAPGPKLVGSRAISTGGLKASIPVYHMSTRGHRTPEVWPSISYELVGFSFAAERYIYKADRFRTPVRTSMTTVQLGSRTMTGPALLKVRDNPEPYDLMFQIDLWAKHDHDAMLLNKAVVEVFPARGAITARQEDGTLHTWEMYLSGVVSLDGPEPTAENQLQKDIHWAYTYVVETVLDNTLVAELRRTVLSPNFELEAR